MKNKIGTIAFVSIVCLAMIAALLQYRKEQEDNTFYSEYESVIPREDENTYDITKEYYENYDDSGLETYIIANIFGEEDDYIKELRDAGICEYAFINDDKKIEVKLTEGQREAWIEMSEENIADVLSDTAEDALYDYNFSEEYTELHSRLMKSASIYCYAEDMILLIYNAEIYQILTGAEEWSVHIVVENKENGKEIMNIQFPQERIDITPEMWDE